jgi:hypothetical protein
VISVTPIDLIQWYIMFMALTIFWYVMRDISRRLGDALHMRRYYLLYDVGEALLVVAAVMHFTDFVFKVEIPVVSADMYLLLTRGLFLSAALIFVAVTVKYWAWIVPEVLAGRKK